MRFRTEESIVLYGSWFSQAEQARNHGRYSTAFGMTRLVHAPTESERFSVWPAPTDALPGAMEKHEAQ